jgi:hypothetical protein
MASTSARENGRATTDHAASRTRFDIAASTTPRS